ncbi:hypothetical protein [Kitasatospora sp. NPDC001683]
MFRRATITLPQRPDVAAVIAGLRAAADDLEASLPLAVDLHRDGELLDEYRLAAYPALRAEEADTSHSTHERVAS